MILVGNQRGGYADLAKHLMKAENDHVTVHELSGFASDTLADAFNEVYAVSRGTRCKQYLFSCSLNPPPGANVSTEAFEDAISRIEDRLGLTGQPRAIVFHEKEGRRHCHAVWSRIDAAQMKAIPMSFSHNKLMEVARELFIEHDWQMPRGLISSKERDLKNFSLADWQQAKRAGKDARDIKAAFQDSWASSDNRQSFAAALEERGFKLAKGDRRAIVAVDHRGEVYAVANWVGIKTHAVKARLGDGLDLPSVADRNQEFAGQVSKRLHQLKESEKAAFATQRAALEADRQALAERQQTERKTFSETQAQRRAQETADRQARYNHGLRGVVDRLSGQYRRIRESNEMQTYLARLRDRKEADELIFKHTEERRALQAQTQIWAEQYKAVRRELRGDIQRYMPAARLTDTSALDRTERKQRSRGRSRGPSRTI